MKEIIKYVSHDGVEFLVENDCLNHEMNHFIALTIMNKLPEKPDGCDFTNGSGFLQHDKDVLLNVRNEYLEFCKKYTDHKWIQETIDKGFDADPSWAGRILGEQEAFICKHWYRFSCIDSSFREWGQPYYTAHPEEATQKQLN